MRVRRPEPYEPRRRLHVDTVEHSSTTRPPNGQGSGTAWWEWPFITVFVPLRWSGRVVTTAAETVAAFADGASRAIGRLFDLVFLRPLRVFLRTLLRPVRWLGRATSSMLRAPAALIGSVGRWAGRGLTLVAKKSSGILSWVFRPIVLLVERILGAPVRFVARTLTRSWQAAGRLGSLIWRAATRPVWSLALAAKEVTATPLRRLGRRIGLLRVGVRARTLRLRRMTRDV